MSNAREIIIAPIVTEKTMKDYDNEHKVTFEVAKGTNRTQVRQAIEEIFHVKIAKINMVNVRPKTKRMGKYKGQTKAVCKAIVKLAEGEEIKLFDV